MSDSSDFDPLDFIEAREESSASEYESENGDEKESDSKPTEFTDCMGRSEPPAWATVTESDSDDDDFLCGLNPQLFQDHSSNPFAYSKTFLKDCDGECKNHNEEAEDSATVPETPQAGRNDAAKPRDAPLLGKNVFPSLVTTKADGSVAPPPARVPDLLLNDRRLQEIINVGFPNKYNFEVHKILWKVLRGNWSEITIRHVGLQMPDGLVAWAPTLSTILQRECHVRTTILGDINFGACCIDDLTALSLNVDFLVHFGHSCLIPTSQSVVKTMYVFVDIAINVEHLKETIKSNLFPGAGIHRATSSSTHRAMSSSSTHGGHLGSSSGSSSTNSRYRLENASDDEEIVGKQKFLNMHGRSRLRKRVAVMGTVQFGPSMLEVMRQLESEIDGLEFHRTQVRPLGQSEVLGCTAPSLTEVDEVVFVCDGRFHLEAVMIRNPHITYYLYNPYSKTFTIEKYDYGHMLQIREDSMTKVRNLFASEKKPRAGIILGTLGRQGSVSILDRLLELFQKTEQAEPYVFLLSEISPESLKIFENGIDFWIQVACPRLSLDWGAYFSRPCLSSHECVGLFIDNCGESYDLKTDTRKSQQAVSREGKHATLPIINVMHVDEPSMSPTITSIPVSKHRPAITLENILFDKKTREEQLDARTAPEDLSALESELASARSGMGSNILRWIENITLSAANDKKRSLDIENVIARDTEADVVDMATRLARIWPEMDYYSNAGGSWASYGGKDTKTRFPHLKKTV